jgi:hypothetical protein
MKLNVWIALILLVGVPQGLFAAEDHLNEQQKLGTGAAADGRRQER